MVVACGVVRSVSIGGRSLVFLATEPPPTQVKREGLGWRKLTEVPLHEKQACAHHGADLLTIIVPVAHSTGI